MHPQSDLLSWRADATTSGPRPNSADGDRAKASPAERWAAFVETCPVIAEAMLQHAQAVAASSGRVSAKAVAEWARATFQTRVNNTAVSAFADWAIERDPSLLHKIERRTRRAKS